MSRSYCKGAILAFLILVALFLLFVVGCITVGIHTADTFEPCSCKEHVFVRKTSLQNE